jgi:hypothetical protein
VIRFTHLDHTSIGTAGTFPSKGSLVVALEWR